MSSKKYKLYRIISVAALPLLIFLISNLYLFRDLDFSEPSVWLMLLFIGVLFVSDLFFIYYSYGKNFRG